MGVGAGVTTATLAGAASGPEVFAGAAGDTVRAWLAGTVGVGVVTGVWLGCGVGRERGAAVTTGAQVGSGAGVTGGQMAGVWRGTSGFFAAGGGVVTTTAGVGLGAGVTGATVATGGCVGAGVVTTGGLAGACVGAGVGAGVGVGCGVGVGGVVGWGVGVGAGVAGASLIKGLSSTDAGIAASPAIIPWTALSSSSKSISCMPPFHYDCLSFIAFVIISVKSLSCTLAPPISKPSTPGVAMYASHVRAVTLPP